MVLNCVQVIGHTHTESHMASHHNTHHMDLHMASHPIPTHMASHHITSHTTWYHITSHGPHMASHHITLLAILVAAGKRLTHNPLLTTADRPSTLSPTHPTPYHCRQALNPKPNSQPTPYHCRQALNPVPTWLPVEPAPQHAGAPALPLNPVPTWLPVEPAPQLAGAKALPLDTLSTLMLSTSTTCRGPPVYCLAAAVTQLGLLLLQE